MHILNVPKPLAKAKILCIYCSSGFWFHGLLLHEFGTPDRATGQQREKKKKSFFLKVP
jgi:hypothetical protein